MNYKYQRGKILGKRLRVPRDILAKVYSCTLSFEEYIRYGLEDKVPLSCISANDRIIVEKFGIEKCKRIDWDFVNKMFYYIRNISFRDLLMSIDANVPDINTVLYQLSKDLIRPSDYPPAMVQMFPDRIIEISDNDNDYVRQLKIEFNNGKLSLKDIAYYWFLFKDKDLSFCLINDSNNINSITNEELKDFMSKYGSLSQLIVKHNDIYKFINGLRGLGEEDKNNYVKAFTDDILANTHRRYDDYRPPIEVSDEEYRAIFKFSSMEEYFKLFYYGNVPKALMEEISSLPEDYIYNMTFPFTSLLNFCVISFINTYGLKNVVDFDNECGHFFSKNDCEMLKLMYDMYLHYAGNQHDSNKSIYTKSLYDENGRYVDRPYTKDEFYEAMRRMIIYGPSDWDYADKAPDYRDMTGEFRVRNKELFIAENAPEELQRLFYTKSITPRVLYEHPEYIEFLYGKDLSSCFTARYARVKGSSALYEYENIYSFIESKTNFTDAINFIREYSDVFDIIYDRTIADRYDLEFSIDDDFSTVADNINKLLRKIIIEKGVSYPKHIPASIRENYPDMFLSDDAPEELKEVFYNRSINTDFILSNAAYIQHLRNVDLELVFKYMPIKVISSSSKYYGYGYDYSNLTTTVKNVFGDMGFEIMLLYGSYLEKVFDKNKLNDFVYRPNSSKEELLAEFDRVIAKSIVEDGILYDENMPSHFKERNPEFFLKENISKEIRSKFYSRQFTLSDFSTNPNLVDIFGNTNVACGFTPELSWIIPLFKDNENARIANYNRLKVIGAYSKINDVALQKAFKKYVLKYGEKIDLNKIEYISEVLTRLEQSNSTEMFTFREELAVQILDSEDPLETLSKIEDVFIKNNIPTVGKIFSCFEILHPDFSGFNFVSSMVSPVLKKSSTTRRKMIVFTDLVKASFGSNNRSVKDYINNIDIGSSIYERIRNGEIKYEELGEKDLKEFTIFSNHLATLYNNSMLSYFKHDRFKSTGNAYRDVQILAKKLTPNGSLDYNIGDRVVKMFCGLAGISTLEQAKWYIEQKVENADKRNREAAKSDLVLEKGDFVKGIGGITYLRNILQNGSVSKEFLGSSASSDSTPLDTDLSMVTREEGTVGEKIGSTQASNYGPIWFVLKDDGKFMKTRTETETFEPGRDRSKLELFYTGALGAGHYGIRTGFASSEVNYIVMDHYDPRVGLEIAMNGFYIPVANREGKIIFTPEDYDDLRRKMSGLSYYDDNNYTFSKNLIIPDVEELASQIDRSNQEVRVKRGKINAIIKDALKEMGLSLKTYIDGDLTEGFVELIDTGSTGRGTNKPGDGDFDFMMRLDRSIMSDPKKLNELKRILLRKLGRENSAETTGNGDFRLKNVSIDDKTVVDIDITFTTKTDSVTYSTDMSLQDRLETIKEHDPDRYRYVVANVLLAKDVLKKAGVYKPNRGEVPQGGLGGVGIENWILQNGGSFVDAARSFVEAARGRNFAEFQVAYPIWDFGENHLAERRGHYSHDNFVSNNMSDNGYQKMVIVLEDYLKRLRYDQNNAIKIER